jgi:hypothetical protein
MCVAFSEKGDRKVHAAFFWALNECDAHTVNQRLRRARHLTVVLNETACGTPEKPGQYQVPMNDKDDNLGEIKRVDGWDKKLEHVFVSILSRLLLKPDQSKLSQWSEFFQDMSEIMTTLRKHDNFSDFDIHCIESKINAWTSKWIALTGRECMTNYNHVLTSVHMIYYLKRWRNLHRFSNQGWENLTASIQYVYHRRSQHRGSAGTK